MSRQKFSRIETYRAKVRKLKLTLFLYLVLFAVFSAIAYRIHLGLLKLRRESCEVVVYGGGPVAWTSASSLLEKGHDVLLYMPSNYMMTTLFIKGSREAISIPSSLAFYTAPLRLTVPTPAERKRFATVTRLPVSKVEEAERKLWERCQKLDSDPKASELLSCLNSTRNTDDAVCMAEDQPLFLDSYNFSWQSLFFPKARTYYTPLVSTSEIEEGVRCSFADGSTIDCTTLIVAEEFPQMSMKNYSKSISLSGPVGYSLTQPIDWKSPFAQTRVILTDSADEIDRKLSPDIFVDVVSDGHEMTINVFSVLPYTSLPSLSFKCSLDLEEKLRQVLVSLGADDVVDSLSLVPIRRSSFGPLPGLYKTPKANDSHIVYLNSLSVPGSSDTLRDTLLLAIRSDIILAT